MKNYLKVWKRWGDHKEVIAIMLSSIFSLSILLFVYGLPRGDSLDLEMIRVVEYKDALVTQLWPRWANNLYFGHGSPIFLYYAPLFSFFSSIAFLITGFLDSAIKIVLFLLVIVGNIATYKCLELFLSRRAAFIGALFFVFAPYKATDIFMRNAFAEVTAFCLFPLVAYFFARSWVHPSRTAFVGLFVSLMLYTCAHPALFMLTLPLFVIVLMKMIYLALFPSEVQEKARYILMTAVLGLLSGAWFLIPARLLTPLVRPEDLTSTGASLSYSQHFMPWTELFFVSDHFLTIGMTFFFGLIIAIVCLLWDKKRGIWDSSQRLAWYGLLGVALYLFLILGVSRIVWDHVPMLQMVQFPWRGITLLSFFVVLPIAYLWEKIRLHYSVLIPIVLLTLFPLLYSSYHHVFDKPMVAQSERFTPEKIAADNHRATYLDEFLPKGAGSPPGKLSTKEYYHIKGTWTPTYGSCGDFQDRTKVEFPLINFPLWRADIDGVATEVVSTAERVQVVTASGYHCVRVWIGFLPVQLWSMALTLCSIVVMGWLFWFGPGKHYLLSVEKKRDHVVV